MFTRVHTTTGIHATICKACTYVREVRPPWSVTLIFRIEVNEQGVRAPTRSKGFAYVWRYTQYNRVCAFWRTHLISVLPYVHMCVRVYACEVERVWSWQPVRWQVCACRIKLTHPTGSQYPYSLEINSSSHWFTLAHTYKSAGRRSSSCTNHACTHTQPSHAHAFLWLAPT